MITPENPDLFALGVSLVALAVAILTTLYLVWSVRWGRPGGSFLAHATAPLRPQKECWRVLRLDAGEWKAVGPVLPSYEACVWWVTVRRREGDESGIFKAVQEP